MIPILIHYSDRGDIEMENINELTDLLKKIDRQDSRAMFENVEIKLVHIKPETRDKIRGKVEKIGNTAKDIKNKVTKFPYVPFVKKTIKDNFTKVANKLRFNESTVNTGYNFIEALIDYKKAYCPDELNRFAYNRNIGLEESVVESTFTGLIESYGKKFRILTSQLNNVEGYNEDYFSSDNTKLMNEFENEVERSTPDKLNEHIANRVELATRDFIEKRNAEQDKIKSIYTAAQNINNDENQSQEMKDAANEAVKINMSELRNQKVPLFEALVVGIATISMKNENAGKLFLNENNTINMDKVLDHASAIYAVMEVCNVTGLVNIDKKFLEDFIGSLN